MGVHEMRRVTAADGSFADLPEEACRALGGGVAIRVLGDGEVVGGAHVCLTGEVLYREERDGWVVVSCGGLLARVRASSDATRLRLVVH